MSRKLTISAANFVMRPLRDFDDLVGQIRALLDASAGADLVVFPEVFAAGLLSLGEGWPHDDFNRIIEISAYEPELDRVFAAEASARSQFILAGSTVSNRDGVYRNVATLHGPDGVVLRQAKNHLTPRERLVLDRPRARMDVVDIGAARVAVNICYDIQFPAEAAALAAQGAEVLLCPSYTRGERGFWRIRHCAHARAVENQIFVVHSAAGGDPDHALPGGFARSAVLTPCDQPWSAPDGLLAETATNEHTAVVATVDLDDLEAIRRGGETTTFHDRVGRADDADTGAPLAEAGAARTS